MRQRKASLCLCAVALFLALLPFLQEAEAGMTDEYPRRFILSGLIELTYEDFNSKNGTDGTVSEHKWSNFSQKYSLGLQGYVYDPRLAVFSTSVESRNVTANTDGHSEGNSRNINYALSATFLPYRPVSLSVYANKTDSAVSSSTAPGYNAFSESYGSMLKLALRGFPLLVLEYGHWEFGDESATKHTESDRLSADIRGSLKSLRTRYLWDLEFDNFRTPSKDFSSLHLRGYTDTVIKKDNILTTRFQYSDFDFSKFMGLNLDLDMDAGKHFSHDYRYFFTRDQTEETLTNTHKLTGGWVYRFNDNLTGRASAEVGASKSREDNGDESSAFYGSGAGLNYRKYIAGLDFRAHYNFSYDKKEEDLVEGNIEKKELLHNLGLSVVAGKLSFGTIHANYDFNYLKSELDKTISHSLTAGVTGKGPGKAFWTIEGGYQKSDGDIFAQDDIYGPVTVAPQGSSYVVRGTVACPLGAKGLATFNSGYSFGKNEGNDTKNFYYEGRLNYRVVRNLLLLTWWRESIDRDVTTGTDINTRNVNLDLNYRFKRLFFTAEFNFQKISGATAFSENKRVLFRLRRPF